MQKHSMVRRKIIMTKKGSDGSVGTLVGATVGAAIGGPVGAIIGGIVGATVAGDDKKSKKPCDCYKCVSERGRGNSTGKNFGYTGGCS